MTYHLEDHQIALDAWWAKVAEFSPAEEDGDTDFMGIYMSFVEPEGRGATEPLLVHETMFPIHLLYHTIRRGPFRGRVGTPEEHAEFDLYWMYVRDAGQRNDTNFVAPVEWVENLLGVDDYDVTSLHTVGTRGAGTWGRLDWELEAAYQFGEADAIGALFVPISGLYGDDGARWNTWACHGEVGYTFEKWMGARVFAGGAYYDGEDNRDLSFWEWLNPFDRPQASISFNRLFSSWREDAFIDASAMTNFWKAYLGVTAAPAESVEVGGNVMYLEAVDAFNRPAGIRAGDWEIPIAPSLSFWTREGSDEIGWQISVWATYQYSEDLSFEAGYSHFFVGDAIDDGVFIDENGLRFVGGRDDEDADYIYFLTTVEF
jgi:hypothetical protein